MTIGIAVVLGDSVLAIADGRTTDVPTGAVVSDGTTKIHVLGPNLLVTVFGITSANAAALRSLEMQPAPSSAEQALVAVKAALLAGWTQFQLAHPDAPWHHDSMRAALIICGRDNAGPFLAATMIDRQGIIEVGPVRSDGANIVIGAEKYGSSPGFIHAMNAALKGLSPDARAEERVQAVVGAGAATIRAMQQFDSSVGGRIHFRALVEDSQVFEGDADA